MFRVGVFSLVALLGGLIVCIPFDLGVAMTRVETPEPSATVAEPPAPAAGETGANVARDGNIAIHEEFVTATEKNTIEAYELFIARHPDHPLTAQATEKLNKLRDEINK